MTMIAYASRTGTKRNLAALREAGWRLFITPQGVQRTEGFRYAIDNGAWTAYSQGKPFDGEAYMATVKRFDLIKSAAELKQVGEQANRDCDAIYMDSLEGIIDANGKPLVNHEVQTTLAASFHGAILGANQYHVEDGALSAVVKTGHEQGETAAEMLLRALRGTPVAEIPVTRNYRGRRVINVSTMESLGIRPRPIVLRGATLVRSTENAR